MFESQKALLSQSVSSSPPQDSVSLRIENFNPWFKQIEKKGKESTLVLTSLTSLLFLFSPSFLPWIIRGAHQGDFFHHVSWQASGLIPSPASG